MKHGNPRRKYLKEFDYGGTFLFILGMLLFLMGISWGGSYYPWKSVHVIVTLTVGFLLLVAFVLYELYMPIKQPLVPMSLFKIRTYRLSVLLWSFGAAIYYANAIIWPNMVATLYGSSHSSVLWVGWASCIPNCGILVGEMLVPLGTLFKKRNWQIKISFTLGGIFVACKTSIPTPVMASTFRVLY
jgi:uncharacterized membrane protein